MSVHNARAAGPPASGRAVPAALAAAWFSGLLVTAGRSATNVALGHPAALGACLAHGFVVACAVLSLMLVAAQRGAVTLAVTTIVLSLLGDMVSYRIWGATGAGAVGAAGAAFPIFAVTIALVAARPLPGWRLVERWRTVAMTGLALDALPLIPDIGLSVAYQRAWIHLPGVGEVMPGEFGRPLILLGFVGVLLSRIDAVPGTNISIRDLRAAWRPAAAILGVAVLMQWLESDLSPAGLLIAGAAIAVALIVGRLKPLLVGAAALALVGALLALTIGYVSQRFGAIIDPTAGAAGASVGQLGFAQMALAWGGLAGVGLGAGLITGAQGLPVGSADMALVVVALELGLAGMMVALMCLAGLLATLWRRVNSAPTATANVLAGTLTGVFSMQACWIVGGSTGLLPLGGIDFPFLSTGGSSALGSAVLIGLVWSLTSPGDTPARQPPILPASRKVAAVMVAALGVLLILITLRTDADRAALNRQDDNPILLKKAIDEGDVLADNGQITQRTSGQLSLNTIDRADAGGPAMDAILGNAISGLTPDGGIGLSRAMRGTLRCGADDQGPVSGPGWDQGANQINGNPATCQPAGLQTTLDPGLMQAAYQALGSTPGSLVIMRATGEILAVVGRNIHHKLLPEIALDANLPPGSSFKTIIATAAIKLGVTSEPYAASFTATDGTTIGDGTCGGDLYELLAVSCDSGFADMVTTIGAGGIQAQADLFGFDQPADVDGVPAYEPTVFDGAKPTPGLIAETGIGQGNVMATTLQMAEVAATVADNGVWHRPRLVNAICNANGTAVLRAAPDITDRAMSAGVASQLQATMRGPLSSEGTAPTLQQFAIYAGGKTGTAQIEARADLGTPAGDVAWLILYTGTGPNALAVAIQVLPTAQRPNPVGGIDAAAIAAKLAPALSQSPAATPPACHARSLT